MNALTCKLYSRKLILQGAQIYPLFPLGGIVYTPYSDHVLNIFEPRYRELYNDILMNGSKRFIVAMSHPTEEGTFAETGVIFQLLDLKEVSGLTGDQIKYICNHRVVGRVKLHRILNPEAWKNRETYLRVEATAIQETEDTRLQELAQLDKDSKVSDTTSDIYRNLKKLSKTAEEKILVESFERLVKLQHDLEEDVRFTRSSISSLAVSPGDGDDSLWQSVRLWQNFIEQRLVMAQNEMQTDFQTKLLEFLKKEKGFTDKDIPKYVLCQDLKDTNWNEHSHLLFLFVLFCSAIGFNDLSPSLQKEVQELQKRMQVELQPLVLESIITIQKILEAKDHKDRVHLLRYFVEAERKRLEAKNTLKGMFKRVLSSSEPSGSTEGRTERIIEPKKDINEVIKTSIFADEDGAFQ